MTVPIDITDDIPYEVGVPLAGATSESARVPESIRWDCSIGSLPFLFAMSDQYPLQRETADFRRQRIDSERNPGEQSLDSGLWIRSQSTWHYGAGLTSAEPLEVSDTEAAFRYTTSGGVDVWTPGQASLLNDSELMRADTGSTHHMLGVDSGVLLASGTTLTYVPSTGSPVSVTWGGSGTITSMTSDGSNYYVADSTGIYQGALPSGSGSKIWDTGAATVVRWVKSRLMATVGAGIYELTGTGPTLPTALDPGTARPSGWTWTDIAEGPAAIYLSGYVGDTATVEKVGVSSTTSTVTLDVPVVVADLPRGELVKTLYSYVGSYLIVGTSNGCRVAAIQSDGSLTLGPLVVESSDGVTDAVAVGSFVYVAAGAKGEAGDRTQRAGLWRIDLGTTLNNNPLLFAHAPDLVVPSGVAGSATQVTYAGGRLWFNATGVGVYRQTDTFVSSGWIETGRIRLGTVESKAWRDIRVLGENDMSGRVTAHASFTDVNSPSSWDSVVSADGNNPDVTGLLVSVAPTPQASLYVAFNLTTDDTSVSPVFAGYQVRAIPAPRRTQLLRVPILLFDQETDRQGARYGQPGSAWSRFSLLKSLESSVSTVEWRDYTTGERAEAYIERVTYDRTNPPTRSVGGNGGICTVLLRLV